MSDDGSPKSPAEVKRSLPPEGAGWDRISEFALTFNGYERMGGSSECAALANETSRTYEEQGELPAGLGLEELRACLFFEQRRWRHFGEDPDEEAMRYIHSLVEAIRDRVEEGNGGTGAGRSRC